MKKPKIAILDGDIIAWKVAFVADIEGDLAIDSLLGGIINNWTPEDVTDIIVALSHKKNFRKEVYPAYKANRKGQDKPDSLGRVFETIEESYNCLTYPKLEADDILGIYASRGHAISVSIDKDLKGVEGWLFNPDKDEEPRYISEEEAEKWFCIQWMSGDSTDGIPGMWRVGQKTAEKLLDSWEYADWYENILEMYEEEKYKPKKSADRLDNIAISMGQCVRILQDNNYDEDKKEITTMWDPKVGL